MIREGGIAGLIAATIELAWSDAQRPIATDIHSSTANRVTLNDRDEARAFLVNTRGSWAESREALCGAVGIDPEALRRAALVMLEGRE